MGEQLRGGAIERERWGREEGGGGKHWYFVDAKGSMGSGRC